MILMDRGKLEPNTPVDAIIPEFAKIKVLDGFDGATPRLRVPRSKATVRHLATHTSGLVYEFWNLIFLNIWKRQAIPRSCPDLRRHYLIPSPLILASAVI